jgi:hypothetical protein
MVPHKQAAFKVWALDAPTPLITCLGCMYELGRERVTVDLRIMLYWVNAVFGVYSSHCMLSLVEDVISTNL